MLFGGSPQLSSAVFADPIAGLHTGRDAQHHATLDPARLEPNPKQRIDEPVVLLADTTVPVDGLIAATLCRVRDEAERVAGTPPASVTITHPHRSLDLRPPRPAPQLTVGKPDLVGSSGQRVDVVGGLTHEYEHHRAA